MSGESVKLEASDGHGLDAYQSIPAGELRGGVVIIQEIFGVNHHIRSVVDQYASAGYAAIAPSLFDRAQKGVELGYTPEGINEGRGLVGKIGWDAPILDIEAAARVLTAHTGKAPAVIGYCWGGSMAWLSACRSGAVSCAVGYYGGQISMFVAEQPRVPVLLHFAEKDMYIPSADIEKIRVAHPEVEVHTYPAGHGFNCDERKDYEPESAALALKRTLAFLDKHLPAAGPR